MTDPVDTDATAGLAALESDLLRKDVAFWIEQSDIWKRLANDERSVTDRLRAVIDNAPHAPGCGFGGTFAVPHGDSRPDGGPIPCSCWKKDEQ